MIKNAYIQNLLAETIEEYEKREFSIHSIFSLPLYDDPDRIPHPLLNILAWASYTLFEDTIYRVHYDGGHPGDVDYRKVSILPRKDMLALPFILPEALREEFLKILDRFDPFRTEMNLYHLRHKDIPDIQSFAAHEWGKKEDQDLTMLMTALINNDPRVTYYNVFSALNNLWRIFPFCDFRIEILYHGRPGHQFHADHYRTSYELDHGSLLFAQERDISSNIALSYLRKEQIYGMEAANVIHGIARGEGDQPPRLTRGVISVIRAHRILTRQHQTAFTSADEVRDAYRWHDFSQRGMPTEERISKYHREIASGYRFRKARFDQYRNQLISATYGKYPFPHPFYDKKQDLWDEGKKNSILAALAQDFYLMRGMDDYKIRDGKKSVYYLSDRQHREVRSLAYNEENPDKARDRKRPKEPDRNSQQDIISFLEIFTFDQADLIREILKRTGNPFLDPRSCALLRIFDLPLYSSFEDKMKQMGFVFHRKESTTLQEAISLALYKKDPETLKEMVDLVQWLDGRTTIDQPDGKSLIWEHKEIVADMYLISSLIPHMKKVPGIAATIQNIAETLSGFSTHEVEAVTICPEIILLATFSYSYSDAFQSSGFQSIEAFPFKDFGRELDDYRFADRFVNREEFKNSIQGIMDNYALIRSGQWGEALKQECTQAQEQQAAIERQEAETRRLRHRSLKHRHG